MFFSGLVLRSRQSAVGAPGRRRGRSALGQGCVKTLEALFPVSEESDPVVDAVFRDRVCRDVGNLSARHATYARGACLLARYHIW